MRGGEVCCEVAGEVGDEVGDEVGGEAGGEEVMMVVVLNGVMMLVMMVTHHHQQSSRDRERKSEIEGYCERLIERDRGSNPCSLDFDNFCIWTLGLTIIRRRILHN